MKHSSTKETAVYAIVSAGAQQEKVAVGDVIDIDRAGEVGTSVSLPVFMVVDGETVTAGPEARSASVTAEVLGGSTGPKISIQKFKNKTGYKRRLGHRQRYTRVKVTDINR